MRNYSHSRREYSYPSSSPARSKVMGVCAGIAHQFGWDIVLVRVAAVLCLLTFTVPTVFFYVVAGVLFY